MTDASEPASCLPVDLCCGRGRLHTGGNTGTLLWAKVS